jgi:hypothetical protein
VRRLIDNTHSRHSCRDWQRVMARHSPQNRSPELGRRWVVPPTVVVAHHWVPVQQASVSWNRNGIEGIERSRRGERFAGVERANRIAYVSSHDKRSYHDYVLHSNSTLLQGRAVCLRETTKRSYRSKNWLKYIGRYLRIEYTERRKLKLSIEDLEIGSYSILGLGVTWKAAVHQRKLFLLKQDRVLPVKVTYHHIPSCSLASLILTDFDPQQPTHVEKYVARMSNSYV